MGNTKKEIYLIRHGETEFNKLGVVQGSGVDSDLNETGIEQAIAFYEMYKDVPFEKIYVTELKRTHQTVEKFIERNIPFEIIPEFNEISWGDIEGKMPNTVDTKIYEDLLQTWAEGNTKIAAEGGENPENVALKQKNGLLKILANKDETLILVAMHGRAMRILLTQIANLPISKMDTFPHTNTCLYKLLYDYDTEKFEIVERNNTDHFALMLSLSETKS